MCLDLGGCSPSLYEAQSSPFLPIEHHSRRGDESNPSAREPDLITHATGPRPIDGAGIEGHVLDPSAPRRCRSPNRRMAGTSQAAPPEARDGSL